MKQIYKKYVGFLDLLQHPFLLLLRLYWGWQFFITGKGKVQDIHKVVGFFTDLKIPHPTFNAYLVGTVECFGGLFLLLGLATRSAVIPLIVTLIVALFTAHIEATLNILGDPDTFFEQAPFLFLYATVVVLLFGPGFFSLDRLILNLRKGPKSDNG